MCIASLFAAGIVMNGLAESIQLPAPALAGGLTVMQALQARHSERSFSDAELSPQELSGLLWAANGFNRPDKRTNATGMNKQTIEDFGDCVYGDGAQVGAYARMYLANELARAATRRARTSCATRFARNSRTPARTTASSCPSCCLRQSDASSFRPTSEGSSARGWLRDLHGRESVRKSCRFRRRG